MIDPDVLEAVKDLPDDFWVFAEFRIEHAGRNVSRNVDWFIVRQVPEGSERRSTLILTELKHVAKPLRGDINGTWEQLTDPGEWREIEPSNEHDINHYWQAVNTANTLADWLWNNQRRYREGPDRPSRDFKLWADLLLLSPPTTRHQLPLKPRYGSFWYRIEDWLYHIMSWDPERGLPLTERELYNLADVLGLKLIYESAQSSAPAPIEPRPEPRIQPCRLPTSRSNSSPGWAAWSTACTVSRSGSRASNRRSIGSTGPRAILPQHRSWRSLSPETPSRRRSVKR